MSTSPAETVFCIFRVKEGMEGELLKLCRQHDETLRRLDLCSDTPARVFRGGDGHGGNFVVKIFEWKSPEALAAARSHPDVQILWEAMEPCCERMEFPHLEPVSL